MSSQIPKRQVDLILICAIAMAALYILLFASCCPTITPSVTETTVTKYDTVYVQKNVQIPPDEFEQSFLIQDVCDSFYRATHPVTELNGKKNLSGSVKLNHDRITFKCNYDSLKVIIDSLMVVNSTTTHDKVTTKIVEVKKPETFFAKLCRYWFYLTVIILLGWFGLKNANKWLMPFK